MTERMVGYALLIVGFLFILFSAFSVYSVFTARSKPVQLFNFDGVTLNMANLLGSGEGLSAEQQQALSRQKAQIPPQEIVSSKMINESSNIGAHVILMGFLASIGYRIGSLGAQLVRPIVVKLKETTEKNNTDLKPV